MSSSRPQQMKGQRVVRVVRRASERRENDADSFFNRLLGFFDLDNRLALIGSAMQTGVMRQLDLMALRTDRHTRRGNAQFLCAACVASFS